MVGSYRRLFVFVLAGTCSLVAITPAPAAITAYGEVTDAIGDSLDTSLDLVFGSVSITCAGDAIFRIRYAPGYSATADHAQFALDTDQNPSTGYSWWGMGVDVMVGTYGTGFQGTGYYSVGGPRIPFPITYLSDGTEMTIPLSLLALDSDDGWMNFHVTAETQLEDGVYTSIRDWMPGVNPTMGTVDVGVIRPVGHCIPAPASILLVGWGLAGLSVVKHKGRKDL